MLLGEDRIACSHTPHHGDTEPFPQANTARGARQHLDITLALERPEMIFRCVGGTKPELLGDLGAGWRKTGGLQEIGDQLQYFGLARGQFIH